MNWEITFVDMGKRHKATVAAPSESAALAKAVAARLSDRSRVGLVVHINRSQRLYTSKMLVPPSGLSALPDPDVDSRPDTHSDKLPWPARPRLR